METLALFDVAAPDPDPMISLWPGGPIVDTEQGPWGLATASFDSTRTYRFRLSRVWDPAGGRVNFLMLNPSTADAFKLDPTVRRCIGFARKWGAGSLEVTNVFALRSTDPAGLKQVTDPVGAGNDEAIVAAARSADIVVAAWGVHAQLHGRADEVRQLLQGAGVSLQYLRVTKAGHPGHPLYVRANTELKRWV